ncbi:DUF5074 domain-containing protein [Dysgonomonas sp. ZJ279]|uniref:DUF5074 domain-containing protein n=1 Tax=Dysgonomonas sp. ZJ279 TaxID=2709796 RepID=UPI0013EB7699|nr:DUF5074 domain-containing protein [Dysgonomonas sp. ZJ279]
MKRKYLGLVAFFALTFTFASCSDDDDVTNSDETVVIENDKAPATMAADGFYILNEGNFTTDNASLSFFNNDGAISYRAYAAANSGETLGKTGQFATIYGDNVYIVSFGGNRLVVADAKTLKKKVAIENIAGGENAARSFVGVNSKKGYISTNSGISLFDIEQLKVGTTIAGISGEVVNMCLAGKYVFAAVISEGIYVIDTSTDKVDKVIKDNTINSVAQSKDGNIWAGATSKLIKINPYTFEATTEVSFSDTHIEYSWNVGSFCASTQQNVLYWKDGNKVAKYDINSKSLNSAFYTLGKHDNGDQLLFYGAGLRVDPLTDNIVLSMTTGVWGNDINVVQLLTPQGALSKTINVKGGADNTDYYWFPAMPFFKDVNAPAILTNQIVLKPNEEKTIDLNEVIVDADNASSSIIKSLLTSSAEGDIAQYELQKNMLTLKSSAKTGKMVIKLQANSNGKIVEKDIRIDVRN